MPPARYERDGEIAEIAIASRFLAGLAGGPTLAHAATRRVVRAELDHGTRGADEQHPGADFTVVRDGGFPPSGEHLLARRSRNATFSGS